MTLKSLTIVCLFAAGLLAFADQAAAQNRIQDVPANFPPSSFTGRQFVDNNGCVFVRAGFDGAVTWVPRVSRQRNQVCGQVPTFADLPSAGPAPAAASAPAPVVIAPPAAEPVAAAPVAAPTARASAVTREPLPRAVVSEPATTAAAAATATARATATSATARPTGSPLRRDPAARMAPTAPGPELRVVTAPKAPAPAQPETSRTAAPVVETPPLPAGARIVTARSMGAAACQGASGTVTREVNGKRLTVRCGPQEVDHVTVIRRGEAPAPGKSVYDNPGWQSPDSPSAQGWIVPRHVYEKRDDQVVQIPKGYRPAWQDDRLNRYRAVQTRQGYKSTQEVWTNEVPRDLVARDGKPAKIKEPVIAYRATSSLVPPATTKKGMAKTAEKAPVVSTKAATPRKPQAKGQRWVEIGVFTTEAKAQEAARRLQQAGLPVKFGLFRKNGQDYRRLLVGPYASEEAIQAAMRAVHRVGYTSAYLR